MSDMQTLATRGHSEFDVVIGLEVHIQLNTETKLFCSCKNAFGALPNHHSCPVCLGQPGVLPVLNSGVVDRAVAMSLAIGAKVQEMSVFARKQYFYPDLPKGYQITQFDLPYSVGGEVVLDSGRRIEVERIHIEEDAGKSVHGSRESYVDLNRAGTPLLEMVSKPQIETPREASEYLKKVRSIVRYLGIGDGNLQEGSFRCDANISLKPAGQKELGTRTEIKNVNSFRNVERALSYEILRQTEILRSGEKVLQETLRFDAESGKTRSNRSKEMTADYRYFPDPDLGPLYIDPKRVEKIAAHLPQLASMVVTRYLDEYGLTREDALVLTEEKEVSDFFDQVVSGLKGVTPKIAANFVITSFLREVRDGVIDLCKPKVTASHIAELLNLVGESVISGKIAKTVFSEMLATGQSPSLIVKEKGLAQVSDTGEIEAVLEEILRDNPSQLAAYLGGKEKILGFFVGQVMKRSKGTYNPQMVNKILKEKLSEKRRS